jgi:hypothetical protein
VVGIRGLLHPPHICATLQFLEVPPQNWPLAVESTVLASVNAFYFLHRVRFGGPSERGLCAPGCDNAGQAADASDSSDLEELRVCTGKHGSPWSPSAGAIPQRAPKLLKRSRQTSVDQGQVPLTYVAGSAKSGASDTSSPSCQTGQGMDGNLAGHGMGERRQDVPERFASITAAHRVRQVRSTNARPPPLASSQHHSSQHHSSGTQAQWQGSRHGRSRPRNRLRLLRVGAHGTYDTNDPLSYLSPVCRRRTASHVDELWDRWRLVEGKKRRRT